MAASLSAELPREVRADKVPDKRQPLRHDIAHHPNERAKRPIDHLPVLFLSSRQLRNQLPRLIGTPRDVLLLVVGLPEGAR